MGQIGGFDYPSEVTVSGPLAFVADQFAGLKIVDVSSPTTPVLVSSVPVFSLKINVGDSFAYVASGYGGVKIVDVSIPTTPTLRAQIPTEEFTRDAVAAGGIVFIADDDSFRISNAKNPDALISMGQHLSIDGANNVATAASIAFVTQATQYPSNTTEIRIIDLSSPRSPVVKSSLDVPRFANLL